MRSLRYVRNAAANSPLHKGHCDLISDTCWTYLQKHALTTSLRASLSSCAESFYTSCLKSSDWLHCFLFKLLCQTVLLPEAMTGTWAWSSKAPPPSPCITVSPCSTSSHTWPRWSRCSRATAWTHTRWDRSLDPCWYGVAPPPLGKLIFLFRLHTEQLDKLKSRTGDPGWTEENLELEWIRLSCGSLMQIGWGVCQPRGGEAADREDKRARPHSSTYVHPNQDIFLYVDMQQNVWFHTVQGTSGMVLKVPYCAINA